MIKKYFTFNRLLLAGAVLSGLAATPSAIAQSTPVNGEVVAADKQTHVSNYVDLKGSLGIAFNPRLQSGQSSLSGVGRVSAYGVHSVVGTRNSFDATAFVENQTFTGGTGSTQSFALGLHGSHIASPTLSFYSGADFSGDVGGQLYNRFVSVPNGPPSIDVVNPLPNIDFIDPGVVALNRRSYHAAAQAGFSDRISLRNSIDGSVGYSRSFFTGGGPDLDYDTVNGSLGWRRILSERASAGLRLGVSHTNNGSRGSSTVYSPQLTGSLQLSEGWTANGAVGVDIDTQNYLGLHSRNTGLSLSASVCKATPSQSVCASVSRGAQTTVGQGLTTSTSGSLSYFRRLDPKNTVQASVSVGRTSGSNGLAAVFPTATFYAANVSYNRQISPRLSTGADLGLRKYSSSGSSVPVDANAAIYIRYRLGDLQ